ncbi:MAG: CHAT domain-containing tetratricopeptide repeat protein [Acidobacteriota bacterium]
MAGLAALWLPLTATAEADLVVSFGSAGSIERAVSAGDREVLTLDLGLGGPIRIDAEQLGADVALELVGRGIDGGFRVDSPSGRRGSESLTFHALKDERYRLAVEVSSVAGTQGRYRLSVSALPTGPGLATQRRLAAERAMTLAWRRFSTGKPEERRRALDDLGQALRGWRALGRSEDEVRTLSGMAYLERTLGRLEEARGTYEVTCRGFEDLEDDYQLARCLNDLGYVTFSLGDGAKAVEYYRRAEGLWGRLPDSTNSRAQTLNNLGLAHHSRGALDGALEKYREALAGFRATGDRTREGVALGNIAGVLDLMGEPDDAVRFLRAAMALYEQTGDVGGKARALNNMASIQRRSGDFQGALDRYGAALDLLTREDDLRGMARALNNLGLVFENLGRLDVALEHLERSLDLRRRVEDRRGEAVTLHNLGRLTAEIRPAEGLRLLEGALVLRREVGDLRGEAITLRYLGRAQGTLGQSVDGILNLRRAVEILETTESPFSLASSLWDLGRIRLAAGDPGSAAVDLRRALDLLDGGAARLGEARVRLDLAAALRALGQTEEALVEAAAALDLLEQLRANIGSIGFRTSFRAAHQPAYELQVELLMGLAGGNPRSPLVVDAFELSERSRTRGLLDLLAGGGSAVGRRGDTAQLRRRGELLRRLRAKSYQQERALDRGEAERGRLISQEIVRLLTELESFEGELRSKDPRAADLAHPRALGEEQIRSLLDPETTLLQYFLGEERSFLWAVTGRDVRGFALPPRVEIESKARRVLRSWSSLGSESAEAQWRAAEELSRLILGPVADRLTPRLVVAADGALHLVPFAALPAPGGGGRRLIDDFELVHIPSASVLSQLRDAEASAPGEADPRLAIFADPVFSALDPRLPAATRAKGARLESQRTSWSRLPWTQKEAEAVLRHLPPGQATAALGLEARRERVLGGELAGYRFLHFATHGRIDGERPELSGLALTGVDGAGRTLEGFLPLHDISRLELAADLVVLSGCETALGKEVRGEGMVGLTRGFFHAGARRLMASLWRVEDRATAELMDRFYRHLLQNGEPPSAALRRTQLEMRNDPRWRDPYHWAAFVVAGDWRARRPHFK